MASRGFVLALFLLGAFLASHTAALKTCYEACKSNDECEGQLACMNGKCNDDPGVGTHICSKTPPSPGFTCPDAGTITAPTITPNMCSTLHMSDCCETGKKYKRYTCSPPVVAETKATLTVNGFGQGEDGGGAGACPPYRYYSASEKVVALSTGWYNSGKRCGKTIRITGNGRSTTATVVDECDSRNGCDKAHAYQPPCQINIVDASEAVWRALGVSPNVGMMDVTWSQIN